MVRENTVIDNREAGILVSYVATALPPTNVHLLLREPPICSESTQVKNRGYRPIRIGAGRGLL
jgi:hypothetical protein